MKSRKIYWLKLISINILVFLIIMTLLKFLIPKFSDFNENPLDLYNFLSLFITGFFASGIMMLYDSKRERVLFKENEMK